MTKKTTIPTINDVAAQAGVSKRTVSRVLNKSDKVNDKTRRRIQKIIDDLDFTPSSQARGLAARRSYLLGLIYDVPTLFTNEVQKGVFNVSADEGYDIVVHPCESSSPNLVNDVRRFVRRAKVDGIIALPPVSDMTVLIEAIESWNIPYVRFSADLSSTPWRQVVTNYVPAIEDMTNHLVELGHRRIAFISGPKTSPSSQKRQQVFVEALAQHGLELRDEFVIEGAFTYESGVRAAKQLLKRESRPTAIFAANDEMAFGVMNVADALRIEVPEDLSVVGFDGTRFANFVIPSLTTIHRPSREMAGLSARKLLAYINEGVEAAQRFESMVSPRFVPRDSTGPAPEV